MEKKPDFRLIKSHVSMLDVLGRYEVNLRAKNQYERAGDCPLPQHQSESKGTFKVKQGERGWGWSCHSATCVANRNPNAKEGHTKKGGDLIEFVKFMEQLPSLYEAGRRLEQWFGPFADSLGPDEPQATKVAPVEVDETPAANEPLKFVLSGVDHNDPYLLNRGFEEEECEYLGVAFFPGKGSMAGRIVFPIQNSKGELVGYAGRAVGNVEPRWLFPKNFRRGVELWNLHRVEGSSVIVVESFWGVMACIRGGIMNSVALMGSTATKEQARLLGRFDSVVLLLDGDDAGRTGTRETFDKLVDESIPNLNMVFLRQGEQPDHLGADELRERLSLPPEDDGLLEVVEPRTLLKAVPA